jgi:hypothetical protein
LFKPTCVLFSTSIKYSFFVLFQAILGFAEALSMPININFESAGR